MLTDYHNHILPGMDDGSKSASMSAGMMKKLRRQGIERIVATPHYYCHNESVNTFIERRSQALDALNAIPAEQSLPVIPAAELYLHKSLASTQSIEQLAISGSRLMLLELPYAPFQEWIPSAIIEIAKKHSVRPIIAHLDRYLAWYYPRYIEKILFIPDIIVQINNVALLEEKTLSFALTLIRSGLPVVLGSDTHNLDLRAPNFDTAFSILRSRLGKADFDNLIEFNRTLI